MDVFCSNAGMSIIRPMLAQKERLHDYMRTRRCSWPCCWQTPSALHIVHSSSIVCEMNPPGFTAYTTSKQYAGTALQALATEPPTRSPLPRCACR